MDGHSPSIRTVGCRCGVAELVDASLNAAELVIASTSNWEANLRRIVGLPGGSLTTEGVVTITGGEPGDVSHVERDKTRSGGYAPFIVVVPRRGRTVGLNLRNLVTAIPRRGRNLTGEVF